MVLLEGPYQQYMYSYPHKTAYGPLAGVFLPDYLQRLVGKKNSLYVHIPYCQYKCGYCNLFSLPGQGAEQMGAYVDAMERQSAQIARHMPGQVSFEELTLGGGTPLLLPARLLERVFWMARHYFGFSSAGGRIAVETSPNQTDEEKLALLKEAGVGRISIGVQSFQEQELAALHRFHSVQSAKNALRSIQKMRFPCVNIDLIYGIKGQTISNILDSLKQALEFEPDELFVYPLYVQPGTYLYKKGERRQEAETMLQMYRAIREFLNREGYQPYSMRRFVKKGRADAGQLPESLCGFGNTLSIGCGGRSYIDNLHFCTPYAVSAKQCLQILSAYQGQEDYLQVTHGYLLSDEEIKRRYVIRHLLFGRGVSLTDYQRQFQEEVSARFWQLLEWERDGYVVFSDGYAGLTEEGFALSDYLGPQLISDAVRKRSERYFAQNIGSNV